MAKKVSNFLLSPLDRQEREAKIKSACLLATQVTAAQMPDPDATRKNVTKELYKAIELMTLNEGK